MGLSERRRPGFGLHGLRGLAELGSPSPTWEMAEAQLVKRGVCSVARVMLKCQWDARVDRARGQPVCWVWSSGWQP